MHNFYGRYDQHGQPRAAYPPGRLCFAHPVCHRTAPVGAIAGVPADDTDLVVAFSSCLSSATFSALTVTFFFLLLIGIGIPARVALFATTIVGLGTPIFAYSAWLFSEPLTSTVFVGVALLLFGRDNAAAPIPLRSTSIAGWRLGWQRSSGRRTGWRFLCLRWRF